ncbi:hypothetical protein CASFOL_003412 [Castilleja foliolosa]|uniref:Uncharacterized protein n=1 Tax=Castilleja foliolosa TaxID=1961234 RepID=A0ABD3EHR4_9LAMI
MMIMIILLLIMMTLIMMTETISLTKLIDCFDCKNTQAKDEIYGFLEEIRTLEKDWVEDDHKGTAEELKLENQIKVVQT